MEIKGAVAIVTGASAGIGRASAKALAARGASVIVGDIDDTNGNETVKQIKDAGGEATYVNADVGTPDGVRALVAAAESAYGWLDIMHNNAGIMGGEPSWPDTPLERLALVSAVNFGGVMMGTQAAVQAMRKRGGGAIVNTASVAGLAPLANDAAYGSSKAAVIMLTQTCKELRDTENVRVNAVLPGIVDTDIINKTGDGTRPAEWLEPALQAINMLQPEEIAEVVVEFVEDESLCGETRVVANPA